MAPGDDRASVCACRGGRERRGRHVTDCTYYTRAVFMKTLLRCTRALSQDAAALKLCRNLGRGRIMCTAFGRLAAVPG